MCLTKVSLSSSIESSLGKDLWCNMVSQVACCISCFDDAKYLGINMILF